MSEPERPLSLLPRGYTESRSWRFLLDTRAGQKVPDEPRFKQFTDNLTNYTLATLLFKAAQAIPIAQAGKFEFVGKYLLFGIAGLMTLFCFAQQFGLVVLAFHAYIGFTAADSMALKTEKRKTGLGYRTAYPGLRPFRALAKMLVAVILPLLFVWAMMAFVVATER